MKGFDSVADLSRFAHLRQANARLKSQLAVLSQEVSTGLKSDVTAATGGNLGRLAQVQTRLTLLEAHGQNASMAQTQMEGLQIAMDVIGGIASQRGGELLTTLSDATSLDVRSAQALQDFHAVVRAINTDVGGRFVLSGTAVTTAPLPSSQDILDLASAQVAGLTDPADITATLDAWFAAPDGFAVAAFHGNTDPTTATVGHGVTVQQGVAAIDPALRDVIKGLAIASIASLAKSDLSPESRATLLNDAGRRVSAGAAGVTNLRAQIGMQQQIIAEASARNAAEVTSLSMARSDILAADPYETASALTQTEASLQTLYSLTARLSRLSLADYL